MKKIVSLILLATLMLVGACSDNDKDEPDPVTKPEYPSEEVFENEIKNNLWVLEENRYETEDGVDFSEELCRVLIPGPGTPYQWYFWDNNAILCVRTIPPYGEISENINYDPSSGLVTRIGFQKLDVICQILSYDGEYLTVKRQLMYYGDPGDMDGFGGDWWDAIPNKEQCFNKMIYQVAKFKKKDNPNLKEEFHYYLWEGKNPGDYGLY